MQRILKLSLGLSKRDLYNLQDTLYRYLSLPIPTCLKKKVKCFKYYVFSKNDDLSNLFDLASHKKQYIEIQQSFYLCCTRKKKNIFFHNCLAVVYFLRYLDNLSDSE